VTDGPKAGDPTGPFPEAPDVLFAIGGLFAAIFLGAIVVSVVSSAIDRTVDLRISLAGQFGLWVGMVGAVLLAARFGARTDLRTVRTRFGFSTRPVDMAWALLGPVLQAIIGLAYRPFVDAAKLEAAARKVADLAKGQVIAYVVLSVSVVVGAPIVEELFFRGLLLRAVSGQPAAGQPLKSVAKPRLIAAVIVSGVVFGLIHFELLQLPALIGFGMLSAVLAVRFGRLGPSIWLHVGFNATTMIALSEKIFHWYP
jgi:uncharacterized protein